MTSNTSPSCDEHSGTPCNAPRQRRQSPPPEQYALHWSSDESAFAASSEDVEWYADQGNLDHWQTTWATSGMA